MMGWLSALIFAVCLSIGASAGTLSDVTFATTSPLSSNRELARRLLSPLTATQIPELLAQSKSGLRDQPVNVPDEKFILYVPTSAPPNGYVLLVFVPPWQDARLPDGWADVLDKYGVIFVSAAGSGNPESVLGRREPLALLAEQNVVQRYRVDSEHIFIGGFSGGSRVAMLLALGYPDVFRGAFLDAGSDPIGSGDIPLPPNDLFDRFQASSHLVYVTGENDIPRLAMAAVSKKSMRDFCVAHVDTQVIPRGVHAVANAAAFSKALAALLEPVKPDPERLAACRSDVDNALSEQVRNVESLIAKGRRDAAQRELGELDHRFGGLAAPRSVELQQEISRMAK